MCECRKRIESALIANFIVTEPTGSGHSIESQNYGYGVVSSGVIERAFMEYKCTATFPLKKGGSKSRTSRVSMFFSHCPFCGAKYGAPAVAG